MVTALLLMLSAAQVPPGFVEARASLPQPRRQRVQRSANPIQAATSSVPRGRLDIDLSGLSDDDAVVTSSPAETPHRLDPFVADLISNVVSDPAPAAAPPRQARHAQTRADDPYPPGSW